MTPMALVMAIFLNGLFFSVFVGQICRLDFPAILVGWFGLVLGWFWLVLVGFGGFWVGFGLVLGWFWVGFGCVYVGGCQNTVWWGDPTMVKQMFRFKNFYILNLDLKFVFKFRFKIRFQI